jgi:hypothetical protein
MWGNGQALLSSLIFQMGQHTELPARNAWKLCRKEKLQDCNSAAFSGWS